MEKRKTNIMFAKNGQGNRTMRMTLPVTWVDKLGATEDNREVFIYEVAGEIIITKEELKMEENKALEMILKEIRKEIKEKYIDNSDYQYYLFDVIKKIISMLSTEEDEEENIDKYTDSLYDKVLNYLNENYKVVYQSSKNGDATVYYYDNCFDFKDVESLEKYFKIGE